MKAITGKGELKLAGVDVDCYVLEDGRRVITKRALVLALSGGTAKHGLLDRYIDRIPSDALAKSLEPEIEFELKTGGRAIGREAQDLVAICRAYQEAFLEGKLHHAQEGVARSSMRLLGALAGVGIDALVDEATGYQTIRKDGALARLFDRLFRREPADWERMFKDSLVASLCKLHGHPWMGGAHPRFLASTNEKIYKTILSARGYRELKARNPVPHYKRNHHQQLTPEAKRYLREQLSIVEVIANQSKNKDDFWARFERQYSGALLQLDLPEAS